MYPGCATLGRLVNFPKLQFPNKQDGYHNTYLELCPDYIKHSMNVLYHGKLTSLVAQTVKNPLAMQETWVQSLGREDLPEKGMTIHSSILA